MVHHILQLVEESKYETKMIDFIEDRIRNQKLHAVADTSVMNNQMGWCWKIVNFENQIVINKETLNKKWRVNSPKAMEAAIILDMLEFAKESTSSQLEGELIIINYNKFLHTDIHEKGEK